MKKRFQRNARFFLSLLVFFVVGAVSGCGKETNTTQLTPPASSSTGFFDKTAMLQGVILDATTGTRIGGTDLKIVLIQGNMHRTPSTLITDTTDSLVGEYVFTDVPVSLNVGNNTFKVIVTKTGYQRFEGLVSLAVSGVTTATSTILVDAKFNFVRDIYLFPVGQQAPDITIFVEYGKEPVGGAQVLLQQNANVNVPTAGGMSISTALVAAPAMLGSLSGTTTADGKVTFSGSNLVLGGAYTPVVLPIVHDKTPSQAGGVRLQTKVGTQIIVGVGGFAHTQLITMGDLEPGSHADGLHVVFASNRDDGDITGLGTGLNTAGRLTLAFNRPIDIVVTSTSTSFTATLTKSSGQAVLSNDGLSGSVKTPILSSDGLTLTLDPVFGTSTPPLITDRNVKVTYAGGGIRVQGDEAAAVLPLEALSYLDGTLIRREVTILGP